MAGMQLAGKKVVHQVHPGKIGADVTASVVSNVLLWQGRPEAALTVRVVLLMAGSPAVLTLADLDALAKAALGRHVFAHMPPSVRAVRLAADAVDGPWARRRSFALLLAGAAVIAVGWSHAWPRRARARETSLQPRDSVARRYWRTGQLSDLDEAIAAGQAVEATPVERPDRATDRSSLAARARGSRCTSCLRKP